MKIIFYQKLKKKIETKIKKLEKENRFQYELNYFYLKNLIILIFFKY